MISIRLINLGILLIAFLTVVLMIKPFIRKALFYQKTVKNTREPDTKQHLDVG